uniref:Serpin domain-containing protein n=1 Tax=Laticauda laticaudata TaxID=8630 RepID=A0A8C5SFP2_LATLA
MSLYMLCALVLLWLNLALMVFSLISHGHHDVDHSNDHHDLKAALKIQCNVADFAIEFYKIPAARSHEENLVFSPCSISMLLSVLLLGTDSNTHTEILNGLSFNMTHIQEDEIHQGFHELLHLLTHSEKSYKLDIGQALFLKEDKIKEFYEAEIQTTKFQEPKEAEKQINDYIKKKNHLLEGEPNSPHAGLILLFKYVYGSFLFSLGNWKSPFDPAFTREEDFFVDHNTTVKVQMMHRTDWFYHYFDRQLSCTVLQIDDNGIATTFFSSVSIPKFSISAMYSLKEPLSQLSITEIFTDHADLTGVTRQPLKLSKVSKMFILFASFQAGFQQDEARFHRSNVNEGDYMKSLTLVKKNI